MKQAKKFIGVTFVTSRDTQPTDYCFWNPANQVQEKGKGKTKGKT
jgi:hypothetical protein